jgi:chromosome segregation ATPase
MEEKDPTPEKFLDRQAQAIQFRVQQHLSLRDEEVERLSNVLNGVKTKILEARQQIREIDREIIEAREYQGGDARRKAVGLGTSLAKVRARHHKEMQELQNMQTGEIEIEQAQFEAEMERLTDTTHAKLAEQMEALDVEIGKHRKQVEAYQASATKIEQHEEAVVVDMEEHVETVNSAVIEELQEIVQQRNAERYQNLQQSKEKLSQCIETLDQMMRVHALAVNDRRTAIKEIEQKYESELVNLEERHRATKERLTANLRDVQQRTSTLLKAAHHLERSNQKQLSETMKELELMKNRTMARTDQPLVKPQDHAKVEAQKKNLEKLTRRRIGKEENLNQVRGTNQDLKREIWRIRHDLRFASSSSSRF